jgi:hypothetical protein
LRRPENALPLLQGDATMKWSLAVLVVVALGCSRPVAEQHALVYEGQRMAPVGTSIAPPRGDMVAIGKLADGRAVYQRRGGGGGKGGGEAPIYIESGPGVFVEVQPMPLVGR